MNEIRLENKAGQKEIIESSGFTTILGALIGSVVLPGGIGTLSDAAVGAIIGVIAGTALSGLYQFTVEQEALDNGIWIDLTVRGHFTVLGHTMTIIYHRTRGVLQDTVRNKLFTVEN